MSAKREQFLKMIGQGWSVAAAARELGISPSSANNWKNGYRVARTDGTVVVFEPLTPTPQPISARFLSQEERLVIADEFRAGASLRTIAALLGRPPSTISREVRRNRGGLSAYRPFTAEQLAPQRRRRHPRLKIEADPQLGSWVAARLAEYWSPSEIARALPATFPGQRERHLAHETNYRAVYRHQLPPLARGQRSCLRTGRTYRKAHRHPSRRRARFGLPVRMISAHPPTCWSDSSPGTGNLNAVVKQPGVLGPGLVLGMDCGPGAWPR
ncbi:helix-turn-helix domain-containing protein [Kocuria sp. NPDC057446]|uniref:helix-turn-helix domain-containing protein n=1 Tax=Kocuria sp. NPDC057446 TaxID=3346137 RepID=UPI00367D6697